MADERETHRLPSYRPCRYCGEGCDLGTADEPCWGEVTVDIELEPGLWTHTCQGHSYSLFSKYRPSDEAEDGGLAGGQKDQ